MKHPLFAALLALSALSGCQTFLTAQNCDRALTGLTAAQDVVSYLRARGVDPAIADKIANALSLGQVTVATACAAVPVSPVEGV